MYVTVSLKIHVDATTSLSHLERQIGEAGRAAMKEALAQAIHQTEEQQGTCPACGSAQVQTQGSKRRVLLTSFGRVEVPLKRLSGVHLSDERLRQLTNEQGSALASSALNKLNRC